MKIQLNEISTAGLLRLLRDVAAELETRQTAFAAQPAKKPAAASQPDPAMAALLHAPDTEDADFCLMIAARIRSGGYVRAGERERVAAIAQDFPAWVSRQGLPTVHNAGEWQRAKSSAAAPRARAR